MNSNLIINTQTKIDMVENYINDFITIAKIYQEASTYPQEEKKAFIKEQIIQAYKTGQETKYLEAQKESNQITNEEYTKKRKSLESKPIITTINPQHINFVSKYFDTFKNRKEINSCLEKLQTIETETKNFKEKINIQKMTPEIDDKIKKISKNPHFQILCYLCHDKITDEVKTKVIDMKEKLVPTIVINNRLIGQFGELLKFENENSREWEISNKSALKDFEDISKIIEKNLAISKGILATTPINEETKNAINTTCAICVKSIDTQLLNKTIHALTETSNNENLHTVHTDLCEFIEQCYKRIENGIGSAYASLEDEVTKITKQIKHPQFTR